MILRLRRPDGSVERVVVESRDEPLSSVLQKTNIMYSSQTDSKTEEKIVLVNSQGSSVDDSQTIEQLGLEHGTLLTVKQQSSAPGTSTSVSSSNERVQMKKKEKQAVQTQGQSTSSSSRWNPFPDLAKDYHTALTHYKRRQGRSNKNSFSDIADLQSHLHIVEPQPDGPLKRVYLCRTCAERFLVQQQQKQQQQQSSPPSKNSIATSKSKNEVSASAADPVPAVWLFGVLARERVDTTRKGKRRPKTSLSSTTEAQEYCHVAHVHAMWEEEGSSSSSSSSSSSPACFISLPEKVEHVAEWLGLRCVGWMFAYADEREEGVPVHGRDVIEGAHRQIYNMKRLEQQQQQQEQEQPSEQPSSLRPAFITLAMHAQSGATEAFQLSNVGVQMVAEDLLHPTSKGDTGHRGRILSTSHPILVDGKETQELDSLLCLVNTALLSREGDFAGQPAAYATNQKSLTKKNGALTAKTRKILAAALNDDGPDRLLALLCDFQLLVALHDILGPADCQKLCACVKKWTRQKRGTTLDPQVKNRLKQIVEE